ncbi:MAG TPA: bile acid:sodium symporter family protein [Nocardioides sp.]|nr:bile acid:sodium symporter family protein [Nocardioides sp.]
MDSALTTVLLPLALAVVMLGLGLSLTVDDFRRVGRAPRAVVVALACQLLLLPVLCFGLVLAFGLSPLLAVGMMLLAASPGGTTANLFSHLYGGDVALNITLTALNSVIAVATLPVVTNLAFAYFEPDNGNGAVGLQLDKTLQVFAIVLVPVAIGMLVRNRAPAFAARMDRPVRLLSVVVLAAVIAGTIVAERENVAEYFGSVGLVSLVFCLASLGIGYGVPRLLDVGHRQALASSMEVGIHNSTLAIAIAVSVLGEVTLAVPAAVYAIVMFPTAAVVGRLVAGAGRRQAAERQVA